MIRLLNKAGLVTIDREPSTVDEVRDMATALVGKVDVFMTTTDTLMQGGGEQALTEISLRHGVPILSSNKGGIEGGSTFGPVADFYTLGKMSGEKAAQTLQENVLPAELVSELQNSPWFSSIGPVFKHSASNCPRTCWPMFTGSSSTTVRPGWGGPI